MARMKFMNTEIDNLTMDETLGIIENFILKKKNAYVVTPNVDHIVKIETGTELKEVYQNADLILADGKPLLWIAKLYGNPIKQKISGSDMVPLLCEAAARKGYTIFILGGREGVAKKAAERLQEKLPAIRIVGTYAPEEGFEQDQEEIERINEMITQAHPDILIVCLGCPKQEKWVYKNRGKYTAGVSICAGATVDFIAGNVKRAPLWMREHGLEWFYRFMQEPFRLFKRYFIDDIKIFRLAWKYRPRREHYNMNEQLMQQREK